MDAGRLLDWYDRNKRKMPWREQVSPYRTWVSEIMLQQTQVDVVRGYFERFMQAFPTVHALAKAEQADVLKLWAGLGYYSRGRNLHAAARQMCELHGGEPAQAIDWAELPGIGRYTLGAIRSIAYGEALPVVDGNVVRVYARYFGLPVRRGKDEQVIWDVAERELHKARPGDFNQALMELGATVCSTESPKCLLCPVQSSCKKAVEYPLPKIPAKRKHIALDVAWIEKDERVLAVHRPKGLWHGMLALPAAETDLVRYLKTLGATHVARKELMASCERALTHRDVTLSLHRFDVRGALDGEWIPRKRLREMPSAFVALVDAISE